MTDWRMKRVVVVGVARQGMALARYLTSQGARVILTDQRQAVELMHEQEELADCVIEWALGGHPSSLLDFCDLVCLSGGVPLTIPFVIEAQARGIPVSNDSQIFLEAAPCKVIGITGSAGKTTTTTLVGRMLTAANGSHRTWIGGNIGNPLVADVERMSPDDLAVMELSSFQLEIMTRAPQVAVVLNITPNHLDRHLTMKAYIHAKAQIIRYQTSRDIAILGCEDPGAWSLRDSIQGKLITFGLNHPSGNQPGTFLRDGKVSFWDGKSSIDIIPQEVIALRGEHNLLNVLAACAIARAVDLPIEAMRVGVAGFSGVEHRLEFVRTWGGADWYNDSIATAPERSLAAIRSFDQPLVLLVGGRDKDLPWGELVVMVRQRVDHLIIFGEAREIIVQAVGAVPPGERPYTVTSCDGLEDAVREASRVVKPGDVVLLSPGGTSFDEFRDFAERGERFRTWVNNLPE
jgi:UDP-N-acetylmuramoylalanine--D-glutamate ligase